MDKLIKKLFCIMLILFCFSSMTFSVNAKDDDLKIKNDSINLEYENSKLNYAKENKQITLLNDDKNIDSEMFKCLYDNNNILCHLFMGEKYPIYLVNYNTITKPIKITQYLKNEYLVYFENVKGNELHIGGHSDIYDLQRNYTFINTINLTSTTGLNCTFDNLTCAYSLNNTNDAFIVWKINNSPNMHYYLPQEVNETISLRDFSGNNFSCVNIGSVFNSTGGHNGNGVFMFDGINDYINCTFSTNVMENINTNDISISYWVYFEDLIEDVPLWERLIDISDNSAEYIQFHISENNVLQVLLADGGTIRGNATDSILVENVWYHILMTWDASENDIKLYLNNTQTNNIIDTFVGTGFTEHFSIGARSRGDAFFNGRIDDFRIYNKVLSDTERTLLFNGNTNLIHSHDTSLNNIYQCEVFPFNNSALGISNFSNNLTIIENPPLLNFTNPLNNITINKNITRNGTINYTCYCSFENENYSSSVYFDNSLLFKGAFNNTNVFINYSDKNTGNHNITVFCNNSQNEFSTETRNINIITTYNPLSLINLTGLELILFLGLLGFLYIGLIAIGVFSKNDLLIGLTLIYGIVMGIFFLSLSQLFGAIFIFINAGFFLILGFNTNK